MTCQAKELENVNAVDLKRATQHSKFVPCWLVQNARVDLCIIPYLTFFLIKMMFS